MTERPPGLDDLLAHVADNLPEGCHPQDCCGDPSAHEAKARAAIAPLEKAVRAAKAQERAEVLRDAARVLRAASGSYGSPSYDYELGPGLADAANRLDAMADKAQYGDGEITETLNRPEGARH
ncbi:hypothetical protein [Streptomyces spiralis]